MLIALALAGAGATAQAGWLYVLAAGALGLVGASYLYPHPTRALEAMRSLPARVRVGDEVRASISVTNHGRSAMPTFRVEDRFEAFPPAAIACERLSREARAEAEVTRVVTKRGYFDAGTISVTCGAPFGFLRSAKTVEVASPLIAVPRWVDLRSFPILEPSSFPSDVLHERARMGAGEEFLGVREYRPGDSPRAVHWRSTARAGHLMVREYEELPSTRVAIVLTGVEHGDAPDSSFEVLVSAAASIVLYALSTGHPVDLVRSGRNGAHETLFEPDRAGALEWMAGAKPSDGSPVELSRRVLERLGRRGTVVVCAPTAGRAGAELGDVARVVQSAAARVLVVAAVSSSWMDRPVANEVHLSDIGAGRVRVRTIAKGESLRACLEG
jgi:uncharacterized protein (DUF58 family)